MTEAYSIRYLKQEQIDKTKWDHCIDIAGNGLIYAYSFYLDHMSKQWDALVLDDYKAVMPLTWNKKYGLSYLYQPFLAAQLGIFGNEITGEVVNSFLQAIPSTFRLIEISLNSGNKLKVLTKAMRLRSNYVLELNRPYEELYKSYKENNQRNIKKAKQAGYTVQKDIDVEKVIGLALQQMRSQGGGSNENVDRFRKLYPYLHARKMATTYGIVSLSGQLLASCVFFFSHSRAYYILVGNHPAGRTVGSSHALVDAFIKDHAATKSLLDFEGSDIPSLASFYSGFGAKEEKYVEMKVNRLPFFLKWFK